MYNGTKVLDIHAHVSAPGNGMQVLAALLASNSPIWADPREGGLDARGMTEELWVQRVKYHTDLLDDHNIDAQLVGPRPFTMLGWMQPHIMEAWARFTNHMIARQCAMEPTRYVGAAMLPQQPKADDLSHCLAELEYCVKELDFKGVYLSPDPAGDRGSPGMDQPYWDPIYEACQKQGLVIIVHGTNCLDPRIRTIPQNYQIGFVWEQYLATQLLSHGQERLAFIGTEQVWSTMALSPGGGRVAVKISTATSFGSVVVQANGGTRSGDGGAPGTA